MNAVMMKENWSGSWSRSGCARSSTRFPGASPKEIPGSTKFEGLVTCPSPSSVTGLSCR